ncbi:hypothetical protein [Citrobacter braakii]|uniref:hypothetical protein n=1 Tax=Citrobacter braakii TaxID=57706 RepID=UPI000FADC443|nr:hypothetical protein [Citrobacter braakii]
MKKIIVIASILTLGATLTACNTAPTQKNKENENAAIEKAADYCTHKIQDASKGLTGKTKLTSFFLTKGVTIQNGDTTFSDQEIDGLPYIESTALDNGVPGNSWSNCMKGKGFLINK